MNATSLDLTGKADPLVAELLADVARAAERQRIDFFVVGAAARDLVLEHAYGMKSRRATRDVDLACQVAGWRAYQRLVQALKESGRFAAQPGVAHRLSYRGGALSTDLVPFGGLERPPGEIAWPPDFTTRMRVAGYADVREACIAATILPGIVVKVVSLPGLAVLKLLAWSDRRNETTRDGTDLGLLCRHYGPACEYERLTGASYDVLGLEGYDVHRGGVRLLGRDMAAIMRPETRARVLAVLAAEREQASGYRLALAIAGGGAAKDDFDSALQVLDVLRAGIEDILTR
ncbi:MAG: hypothetical protein A3G81_13965 [Betaproteobacteria bacterium RIFCSPLOWO2_12_FULL_65_14]|nr:MAG: hypothetical protein A3G81_13965 [Betaproteobacteria bacterium RIFCSPLOWO2_12_FULL_65_14]